MEQGDKMQENFILQLKPVLFQTRCVVFSKGVDVPNILAECL